MIKRPGNLAKHITPGLAHIKIPVVFTGDDLVGHFELI